LRELGTLEGEWSLTRSDAEHFDSNFVIAVALAQGDDLACACGWGSGPRIGRHDNACAGEIASLAWSLDYDDLASRSIITEAGTWCDWH